MSHVTDADREQLFGAHVAVGAHNPTQEDGLYMFKPGDIAGIRGSNRTVTVVGINWPLDVETSGGVFRETDLFQAQPTVIEKAPQKERPEPLNPEDRTTLNKLLRQASFDTNGHWKNGTALRKGFSPLEHVYIFDGNLTARDAKALLRAKGKPLDRWVPIDLKATISRLDACSYCGEEDLETETNGKVVRFKGAPCKYAKGLPLTEWELNVPSGKLVVANDLRDLFPIADEFDVNTVMGRRRTALAYAAIGLSHASVGNTCPSVYDCGDGQFKIANEPRTERWDGKALVPVEAAKFDGKKVAFICTDLWWFSICDHAELKRRSKHFERRAADFDITVIKVKPGVYRFRHDESASHADGPQEVVFTRFEWVRDPDPVQDLLGEHLKSEVNAHAFVQAKTAQWPTLYGRIKNKKPVPWDDMTAKDRVSAWQRVADHVFCTLGSGTEWHEKGFPLSQVEKDIDDVDPPSFRARLRWYPFSEPHGGLFLDKLSPSFARLAFRVLESIISFGIDVSFHDDASKRRAEKDVRGRMLVAVRRYRELAAKHPQEADVDYVAWLGQSGRAEAWVRDFQFEMTRAPYQVESTTE